MKIRNINDNFGDAIEFASIDEMEQAINDCGYEIPVDGLKENRDYEIIEE